MQIADIIRLVLMPVLIGFLAIGCIALYYRAEEYKSERDLARTQVVSFNNQLNAILQDYHNVAITNAKLEQQANKQKLEYLASITDLQNANLSGDCMQAVGYMVDASKKLH